MATDHVRACLLTVLLGSGILLACGGTAIPDTSQRAVPATLTSTPDVPPARVPCPVTRPEPAFTPRGRAAAPVRPPAAYGAAWYGDDSLFTMIGRHGERWHDLPAGPRGFGQKTFWWSEDFAPDREFTPSISVAGERLDAIGHFIAPGPGTNATADFGSAMLVGIDIPSAGCWRLTATYREAELSIVVWVGD